MLSLCTVKEKCCHCVQESRSAVTVYRIGEVLSLITEKEKCCHCVQERRSAITEYIFHIPTIKKAVNFEIVIETNIYACKKETASEA